MLDRDQRGHIGSALGADDEPSAAEHDAGKEAPLERIERDFAFKLVAEQRDDPIFEGGGTIGPQDHPAGRDRQNRYDPECSEEETLLAREPFVHTGLFGG